MPHMGMNVMNCSRRRISAVAGRDLRMSAWRELGVSRAISRTFGQMRVEQCLELPERLRVHAADLDLCAERGDGAGAGLVDATVDEVPAAAAVALDLVPAVEAHAEGLVRGWVGAQERLCG